MKAFFDRDIHLGILKGGQLGRMLLQPCMDLGITPHIMDIDLDAPARSYCHHFIVGDELSYDDLYAFGKNLDAITLEFEHVNLEALKQLRDDGVAVFPAPELIEMVQDKGLQKQFYQKHGIPTAPFLLTENKEDLLQQRPDLKVVQKSRLAGYDGKGVVVLNGPADAERAFDAPSVIEDTIDIAKEISVMVARNISGQIAVFPTVEMVFHDQANMLDHLFSPADISAAQEDEALTLAKTLAEQLHLIGLLAVEIFITVSGDILINEIAPRPHNSGHHTIEANMTSQFNQHIRAIFDLPLGSTEALSPSAMINLVGAPEYEGDAVYEGVREFLDQPGVYVHRYGKKITRPYRKMGHITVVRPTLQEALSVVEHIKKKVKVVSCQKSV